MTISKYRESLILFTEENMVNRGKIKTTISVVLKRELTDNEKNELIYLKDNNDDHFFKKYRTYLDSETTKTYINDKLELFQEIKGLTDTIILYRKNEVSKEVLEYTDSSRLNSVAKEYKNDRLLKETFIIQSTIPTIVIMPILAAEADGDVDFATNMVTMTTIAYLAVLPLWSLFLFFI